MVQFLVNFLNAVQGFRKTLVMFTLIILAIVFRIKGYIDGTNMVQLLQGTAIGFFAANSVEHLTNTVREYIGVNGQKVEENDISVSDGPVGPNNVNVNPDVINSSQVVDKDC